MQVISIGIIFCTFASKATASIYIVMIEGIFLTIYCLIKRWTSVKNIAVYSLLTIVLFSCINLFSNNLLIKNIVEGYKNTPSVINNKEKFILEDIVIDKETLKLQGIDNSLIINEVFNKELNEIKLNFYNEDGNEIASTKEKNSEGEEFISFNNEEFSSIKIENLGYGIVIDVGYNDTMNFYVTEEAFKGVGQNGVVIDDIYIKNRFLTELYPLATGRGYTWVNSLPIIKETLLWEKAQEILLCILNRMIILD